nr:MAG TPA: hypothetical protein [Caudoviricetes sp.]
MSVYVTYYTHVLYIEQPRMCLMSSYLNFNVLDVNLYHCANKTA